MAWRAAVIGGSGIGELVGRESGRPVHLPSRYGIARATALAVGDEEILFVRRHGFGHRLPPHRVNYRAIVAGLYEVGIRRCLSSAAVGSLNPSLSIGSYAVCKDLLDVSGRYPTFFDHKVRHASMKHVFDPGLAESLRVRVERLQGVKPPDAVYVCVQGPRYETAAEIGAFRGQGGDVVGMTVGTEAILCTELGIAYGCLAVVTNMAEGLSEAILAHEDVTDVMGRQGAVIAQVLKEAVTG